VCCAVAPLCGPTAALPSPKLKLYPPIGLLPGRDPEASAVTASGAVPAEGVTVRVADGGVVAVTGAVDVAVAPALSLTVTLTVYRPAAVYVCCAVAPGWGPTAAVPSPNEKVYAEMGTGSVEPEASALTASGAEPVLGVTVSTALGAGRVQKTATTAPE
jgi:hypothetical protein